MTLANDASDKEDDQQANVARDKVKRRDEWQGAERKERGRLRRVDEEDGEHLYDKRRGCVHMDSAKVA